MDLELKLIPYNIPANAQSVEINLVKAGTDLSSPVIPEIGVLYVETEVGTIPLKIIEPNDNSRMLMNIGDRLGTFAFVPLDHPDASTIHVKMIDDVYALAKSTTP